MSNKTTYRYNGERHPLYRIFQGMKKRCYNENYKGYKFYGARGITIAEEWLANSDKFVKWGIENGWKKGLCIDRRNTKKKYRGYSSENCRFITQAKNNDNRINSKHYTYKGKKVNAAWVCKHYDITRGTFDKFIKQGCTPKEAVRKAKKSKILKNTGNFTFQAKHIIKINEEEFSLNYICKKYNIDPEAVIRLKKEGNLTDKKIVRNLVKEKKIREKNFFRFNFKGKILSINQIARLNGIDHSTIRRHLRNGYNIKEAVKLGLATKGSRDPKYFFKGKSCTLRGICAKYQIPRTSLRRYLQRGFPLEAAVKTLQLENL